MRGEKERERDLAADDDDERKRLPESRQCRVGAAVVAEDRTGPLNSIDEAYQALHGGHWGK